MIVVGLDRDQMFVARLSHFGVELERVYLVREPENGVKNRARLEEGKSLISSSFDHYRKRLTIFTKGQKVREIPIPSRGSRTTWSG